MADPGSSSAPGFDFGDEEQVGGSRSVPQARRVAVLLPLPLPEAYDYKVPAGMELGEGDYVEVPLGPASSAGRRLGAGSGRGFRHEAPSGGPALRHPADAGNPPPLHRLGRRLHHGAARRRAAHGPERHRRDGAAQADHRLPARRSRTAGRTADDRGTTPRARPAGRRAAASLGGTGAGGRMQRRRRARSGRCRRAGAGAAAPDPQHPRSRLAPARTRPVARTGGGGGVAARQGRGGRLQHDAAGRRHRFRQDGGLFRSHRRLPGGRPASAGPAAGNRPVRAVAGALRHPVRRTAAPVAQRPVRHPAAARRGEMSQREPPASSSALDPPCSCPIPTLA